MLRTNYKIRYGKMIMYVVVKLNMPLYVPHFAGHVEEYENPKRDSRYINNIYPLWDKTPTIWSSAVYVERINYTTHQYDST